MLDYNIITCTNKPTEDDDGNFQESEKSFKKAKVYREYSGLFLIVFYFLGVTGSAIINKIIHIFVNEDSFIHSHGHQHTQHTHHNHRQRHHNQQDHTIVKNKKINSPLIYKNEEIDNDDEILHEGSPLLKNKNITYYANAKDCNDIKHLKNSDDEKEKSQLMHIGIQTALAISIHKFPEGLVTFITSKVSPTIGFTLFFAIALHNISEGFTIALPLYMATRSRIKSFLYASLLGGLSQPLGALIGYLFLKESQLRCWDHNFVYGTLFAAVSGLMSVICVQGLLPQAIKNDTSNGHTVTIFFFIGVLIMGISSALFDHAKYVPE
ncbi:3639_t:CDS:2 [Entrophospora sp. SA101]|nr:3639_t:CDS:2 [Entrophospora sp. SA101]